MAALRGNYLVDKMADMMVGKLDEMKEKNLVGSMVAMMDMMTVEQKVAPKVDKMAELSG